MPHTLDLNEQLCSWNMCSKRLAEVLDAAAIDYTFTSDADGCAEVLYVTDYAFNFWLRYDEEMERVVYSTHWPFIPAVSDYGALGFVNACNQDADLIQYARMTKPHDLLHAYYALVARENLLPRQILRTACHFASGFRAAVVQGNELGLLAPLVSRPGNATKKIVTINYI